MLAGCAVGPDFARPELPFPIPEEFAAAGDVEQRARTDRWWEGLESPELNALVEGVLERNLEVLAATAALAENRFHLVGARAGRFPQVRLDASWRHQGMGQDVATDTTSVSLPAAFEVDFWGRLYRLEESARSSLLAASHNRAVVVQSAVAQTVVSWLNLESLEQRLAINRSSVEAYRQSGELVERRYKRGLTSALAVRQARRALAQAQARTPELLRQAGERQRILSMLAAVYPELNEPEGIDAKPLPRMPPIPPGLPSDLLLRRPDVLAAEARLHALCARIGAARAARFPTISLTGNFGYSSQELDRLFTPENRLYSLAAGLVQPVFLAGELKAAEKAARARYEQGVADWARTVLTAFADVEQALYEHKHLEDRRDRLRAFMEEAVATQEVAQSRYERGLEDYLEVLDAQQARYTAEDSLAQAELAILLNRVTLHRALGGGWGYADVEQGMDIRDHLPF
ncbi:MAG: efflux transporter outer membrane subunit [Desulfatibacillaceae bacterium]